MYIWLHLKIWYCKHQFEIQPHIFYTEPTLRKGLPPELTQLTLQYLGVGNHSAYEIAHVSSRRKRKSSSPTVKIQKRQDSVEFVAVWQEE